MARHRFDVIVVGAGHAGIEAGCAAARIGARTALVTGNLDTVGKMSCNPAIGGLGKGQLVREVDALGGVMGLATDACGIHFRTLGRSKGPAIWSPRAQCDKSAYATWAKHAVERQEGLFPLQGEVEDLLTDDAGAVRGVRLRDDRRLVAERVVVTTGTFLRGLTHQGEARTAGGRMGEHAATGISAAFERLGLRLIRLKTGTPPRVLGRTIDYRHCEPQDGDPDPRPFSFRNAAVAGNRIRCWTCQTTPEAHRAITDNLHRAPMYNGQIDSIGPRYCPSIEDKVVRFADRDSHQLFLEPEGLDTDEVYVNGLSTSLPVGVQEAVFAAIPALRDAHVLRYGYAVEYDAVSSEHLDHRLAVARVPGLYLAGQINGTSGYEEAAIQGLLAGANAALEAAERPPLVLDRADAYAGVLVDDLVRCVPEEPYRMFTSRAEHRLHLRADNADRRLTHLATDAGLVDAARGEEVRSQAAAIDALVAEVPEPLRARIAGEGMDLAASAELVPALRDLPEVQAESAWIDLRYHGYLDRQRDAIRRRQRHRALRLPEDLDYAAVPALSSEGRATLQRRRPPTLGAATGLAGVSEADVETLWAWLQRRDPVATR